MKLQFIGTGLKSDKSTDKYGRIKRLPKKNSKIDILYIFAIKIV